VGAADAAHEVDHRHHQQAGRDHAHGQRDGIAADGRHHAAARRHDDQQEGAPRFREDASPFAARVHEGACLRVAHM